jgi:hypothetical protein
MQNKRLSQSVVWVAAMFMGFSTMVSAQMPPPEPFPEARLDQEISIKSPGHLVLFGLLHQHLNSRSQQSTSRPFAVACSASDLSPAIALARA